MTILAAYICESGQIIHSATNHSTSATSSVATATTLDSLLHLRAQARARRRRLPSRMRTN